MGGAGAVTVACHDQHRKVAPGNVPGPLSHSAVSVFVVVALVFGVPVAVVDVVHMVAVPDRFVRAVRSAMLVLDECMYSLDFLGHCVLLRWRRERTGASVPGCA
jgi:hypothetical protein